MVPSPAPDQGKAAGLDRPAASAGPRRHSGPRCASCGESLVRSKGTLSFPPRPGRRSPRTLPAPAHLFPGGRHAGTGSAPGQGAGRTGRRFGADGSGCGPQSLQPSRTGRAPRSVPDPRGRGAERWMSGSCAPGNLGSRVATRIGTAWRGGYEREQQAGHCVPRTGLDGAEQEPGAGPGDLGADREKRQHERGGDPAGAL